MLQLLPDESIKMYAELHRFICHIKTYFGPEVELVVSVAGKFGSIKTIFSYVACFLSISNLGFNQLFNATLLLFYKFLLNRKIKIDFTSLEKVPSDVMF